MRTLKNFLVIVISPSIFMTLVSGCSIASVSATVSATPSVTQTPTSTSVASMSPELATIMFANIAKQSCFKAQSVGVVEAFSGSGSSVRTIMVPKAYSYLDYNAAYFQSPDTYKIVWELTGLNSCAAYYTFSMAEEAGHPANLNVTFDNTDSTYSTSEDVGQGQIVQLTYSITDGLISKVATDDGDQLATTTLTYGNLGASDIKIIKTAVDRYNKTLK